MVSDTTALPQFAAVSFLAGAATSALCTFLPEDCQDDGRFVPIFFFMLTGLISTNKKNGYGICFDMVNFVGDA